MAFDNDVRAEIADVSRCFADKAESGNFSLKENLHLTLKFLGEVESTQIFKIKDALNDTVSALQSFTMKVSGYGYFGGGDTKTLWLSVDGDKIAMLHSAVENALVNIGFARDTRPYTAHITLARRIHCNFDTGIKISEILIPVRSVTLFQSTRISGKLCYRPLFAVSLK